MTVHRDSASSASDKSEFDTASGDWKEITDGDETKTHNFKYSELQGPKHAPPQGAPPLSYFYMFFTVQLLQEIVVQTNNYADSSTSIILYFHLTPGLGTGKI